VRKGTDPTPDSGSVEDDGVTEEEESDDAERKAVSGRSGETNVPT